MKRNYLIWTCILLAGVACKNKQADQAAMVSDSARSCLRVPARFASGGKMNSINFNGDASVAGMMFIPGGVFEMGGANKQASPDEYPTHKVQVSPFYMDATEVTNAQFNKFIDATGYIPIVGKKTDWEELKKSVLPGTPKSHDNLLVAASLVFKPSAGPVNLNDYSRRVSKVEGAHKPNIVIILADDLGWADLSCYGSTFYETPNLDRLAAQGIRFTNNYASCPVCSPTRSSMMTGKYPVKTGVTDWIRGRQADNKTMPYEKLLAKPTDYQLNLEEETIAEQAVAKGYKTFFAGKWHLGEEEKYWPDAQGFQVNKGGWSKGSPTGKINDTTGGYFTPYQNPKLQDGPPGEYITDRLTNECLQFIDQNAEKPFLMMYSLYAVHNPLQAPTALVKKYEAKKKRLNIDAEARFKKDEKWMRFEDGWKRRVVQDNAVYAAMVENMDDNIGRILQKLKDAGLDDNTLVIFTSDNGGLSTAEGSPTVNGPLRSGKGWLYEGGIRVPLIMRWPGKTKSGLVSSTPVNTIDFYPTIAKAMGSDPERVMGIDGKNIFALLSQPEQAKQRALYWHYPHYSNQGGKPGSAIIKGDYKLIVNYEDNSRELYNINRDVGEKNDLAASQPAVVKQLNGLLQAWLKNSGARFPVANPSYNALAKVEPKGQDE